MHSDSAERWLENILLHIKKFFDVQYYNVTIPNTSIQSTLQERLSDLCIVISHYELAYFVLFLSNLMYNKVYMFIMIMKIVPTLV